MAHPESGWTLTEDERTALAAALDALLPPDGSFPAPSETRMVDDFILRRVPPAGTSGDVVPYPHLDSDGLKAIIATLARLQRDTGGMTAALKRLEDEQPDALTALWRLAVYGYYSRPEAIAAIQRDLAPAYHGAPQPLGYAFAIQPWDPDDPLQIPRTPRGSYIRTEDVRRVDLSGIIRGQEES